MSGSHTRLRPQIWDRNKTAGSGRNASNSSLPSRICKRSGVVSVVICAICTIDANWTSLYLRATSNLRLSHVVLTQQKTQSRGSIPVLSAWIFPQPRTALKNTYFPSYLWCFLTIFAVFILLHHTSLSSSHPEQMHIFVWAVKGLAISSSQSCLQSCSRDFEQCCHP